MEPGEKAGESETIMTKDTEKKSVSGGDPEGGDQVIQSGSADPLIFLPNWETPCSSFFQQKGAIDFKSYLRLKKEEKDAVVQYKAAVKIQAIFKGFLTRCNLQILHGSATKIQALIRGVLGRKKCAALFKKKVQNRHLKVQNEAATKIQAAWRGYYSRKTKLNFKEYKKIQEKNKALRRSIDQINGLESALLNESERSSTDSLKKRRGSTGSSTISTSESVDSARSGGSLKSARGRESVENLIRDGFQDLANNMSANRVAELNRYARCQEQGKADGSLKKGSNGWEQMRLDSVSELFPEFPDIEGIIKPDAEKVESLKEAIRLLHKRMKEKEFKNMEKMHYLLRTVVVPGVYSDIYTNELTEIEKELKAIKFWTPPPDPRKKRDTKNSFVSGKDDLLSKKLSEVKGYEVDNEDEAEYIYHPPFPMVNKKQKSSLTSDQE